MTVSEEETCCVCGQTLPPPEPCPEGYRPPGALDRAKVAVALLCVPAFIVGIPVAALVAVALFLEWLVEA